MGAWLFYSKERIEQEGNTYDYTCIFCIAKAIAD